MRHETTDARKHDARRETIDGSQVSRLTPPRVSGLTSRAQWPKVAASASHPQKLDEFCLLIADCPHSTAQDEGQGFPLVRTPNIGNGRLIFEKMHRVSRAVYEARNKRAKPQAGDLIYAREAPAGNVALITKGQEVCLGQRTVLLRPNPTMADSAFLTYYLLAPEQRHRLLGTATGATVTHVNLPAIRNLEVALPPLTIQRRIADILSAYDDLIENNRRRIAILEETARLTYRKWFGGAEQGGTATLGEIADVVMGQSPESKTYNDNGEGLPFHQGVTGFGFRYPRNEMWCTAGTRFAEEGDILFSVRAPVGRINVAGERIVIGRGLSAMRAKNGFQSWLLYALKHHFSKEDMIGVGCIFASTTKKELLSVALPFPPDEEIAAFEQIAGPIDAQIKALSMQNASLAAARDMLLPRLMKNCL